MDVHRRTRLGALAPRPAPRGPLEGEAALRTAWATHAPELTRFATRTIGDRGAAEEAVQETFLRAWQAADRYDPAAPPATGPVEPLLAHVGGELARRRRRRRLVASGSGAAAVAAAALLAVAVIPSGDPAAPPAPERPLRSASAGVTGSVAILDRFWGTQLTLRAKGLPDREPIVIWVERRGGQRVPAGTLVGLGATPIKAQLGASVRVGDAIAVGVSDDAGRVLLSAPVRG